MATFGCIFPIMIFAIERKAKATSKRVVAIRFLFAIMRAWLLLEGKKRYSTSWSHL